MDSESEKLAEDAEAVATRVGELPLPRPHIDDDVYFRGLYQDRLDFKALARDDPELAAVLRDGHPDFHDPAALRQLTKTLLARDFGLRILLPPDRLCPPVPNRHSYILWIKGLLDSTVGDGGEPDVARRALGLDIGTGASCIYPLLGCAQRSGWQFLASDIDAHSLAAARSNVERNGLSSRVRIVACQPRDTLLPAAFLNQIATNSKVPAFVMTNPPFYASMDDVAAGSRHKEAPPRAACTGASVEMVYEGGDSSSDRTTADGGGGEVAFVLRLLDESSAASTRTVSVLPRVCWFSAMLGKRSSLTAVVDELRARGVDNYAVAVFAPGAGTSSNSSAKTTTRRWAVAWSYGARRPEEGVARGGGVGRAVPSLASIRQLLPPSTEAVVWRVATSETTDSPGNGSGGSSSSSNRDKGGSGLAIATVSGRLDALLKSLALISWEWDARRLVGVGKAAANVWGRAWRRRLQRGEAAVEEAVSAADTALGFVVAVRAGVDESTVTCRWAEGHSEALFQSFCGFLQTQLAAR